MEEAVEGFGPSAWALLDGPRPQPQPFRGRGYDNTAATSATGTWVSTPSIYSSASSVLQ